MPAASSPLPVASSCPSPDRPSRSPGAGRASSASFATAARSLADTSPHSLPAAAAMASRTAAVRSHTGLIARPPGCHATCISPATASAASLPQPAFAATRYSTRPSPLPLAPATTSTKSSAARARHAHPAGAATWSAYAPPAAAISAAVADSR